MKRRYRLAPEFNFPLPGFKDRYNRLVELALVAEKMKTFGVAVDTQRALGHVIEAGGRGDTFLQIFLETTGLNKEDLGKAGEGNTKLVKDWFRERGAPDVIFDKRTKKPQFNAATLTCWASDYSTKEFAIPAAALLGLRKSRTAARFANAYYEVASQYANRVHFDFNVIGTKGERWSASAKFRWKDEKGELQTYSLNAQNVPAKNQKYDFGKYGVHTIMASQRDCFIPDPGNIWAKFDYVGAEACLIAYNSQDTAMLDWVKTGADPHTENAKIMFPEKVPQDCQKLTKEHGELLKFRDAAKPATFGLFYQAPRANSDGKPAKEIYGQLWSTWKQMFPHLNEEYFELNIQRFWAAHSGGKQWQQNVCDQVDEDGYFALPQSGKTIYLPDTGKGHDRALNFGMQSGLGFLINRAIPIISNRCTWQTGGLALLLQVHDEIDLQIPLDRVDEVCGWVSEELSKPADFGGYIAGVPAGPDLGPNWAEVKEYKINKP